MTSQFFFKKMTEKAFEIELPRLMSKEELDPQLEASLENICKANSLEQMFQKVEKFFETAKEKRKFVEDKSKKINGFRQEKLKKMLADFQNYLYISKIEQPDYHSIIRNYALTVNQIITSIEASHNAQEIRAIIDYMKA